MEGAIDTGVITGENSWTLYSELSEALIGANPSHTLIF